MEFEIKFNDEALTELKDKSLLLLETLAENVRVEAQIVVPVDTGNLRDSIQVFEGDDKWEKLIGTTTTTYALFVELGTVKMDAQPYMRPALDEVIRSLK